MGYAFYNINRPNGQPMERGYGVLGKCHQRGCKERIDRGVAYLCYECTWYFCFSHLLFSFEKNRESECFAGKSTQRCERCEKQFTKEE